MKHYMWTDASFEENIHCGYCMISYEDLGLDNEEITCYEPYYHCDIIGYIPGEIPKGFRIPVFRNTFTIQEMIEHYQEVKQEIDDFTGQIWPEDRQTFIDLPYLILTLVSSLQAWDGWLSDGYHYETYTLTELKRLLGGYNHTRRA